jgi:cell division protein FtsB
MKDLQKQPTKNNMKYSSLTLFLLLCVVLVFMYNMIGLVEKMHDTKKKKDTVNTQIESLKDRQANLQANIDKLNTTIGTEEAIRDKYQLVKPGEKMVVIVDENNKEDVVSNTVTKQNEGGFVGFIKNMFN